MKTSLSRSALSLLLLLSIIALSLPQIGYAQTAVATTAPADYASQLKTIEGKVEARRTELGIPGMSLVIVKDDKIIFIKGLGYKDFEKKIVVTPDTQFAIGSATKAFTALSVLMSMDEGKLSLDDSPKKALPYFKMYDSETDKNITIRDLLSHSSGLNRTDLAMITGKLNRAELIQVAAQAKPTAKLREKFQYQNIMFAAAGEIVANVQKMPWEKFVPERIFAPLGMKNSTMSLGEMKKAKDFSFGYDYNFDTKVTEKRPFRDIDQVAPAGSINSSARDMGEWLRFVLNGGTVGGKRLVSEKGYEEWLKPQMKMNPSGTMNYGFGWFLRRWNGLGVVEHGGNIDGFNSLVAMIPEKKLGFVLLTNVTSSSMGNDIMPLIWSTLLGEQTETPKPAVKTDEVKRTDGAAKELIGKYNGPGGGAVEIKETGSDVTFNIPGQQPYALGEKAKDVFALSPLPASYSLKAKRDAAGKVVSVIVTQPEGDFEFKLADASAKPAFTTTSDELIQKAIEASGGETNWRKLTTRVSTFDIDLENQGVKAYGTSYARSPGMTATETTMTALGKTIASGWEYFDGTGGEEFYTFSPAQKYTGKRLDDVKLSSAFYGILDHKSMFKTVEIKRLAKVGDDECYAVEFTPNKGSAYTEFYSTKTFLLRKREGVITSSTSEQKIPYTITFDDYRVVDNVQVAFKTTAYNIGNGTIVTTLKTVKHNETIDEKLFAPKKVK